jgi:L-ascorbate metabolism protein UlaG (beta-lactamase superfamily)
VSTVKLKWLGHAGFEITIDGKNIVVDPFISENPKCTLKLIDVAKADIVALTHNHFDHRGDCIEIAKRDGASFVCSYENKIVAEEYGLDDIISLNIGGSCVVKEITIVCTTAQHSGNPCGFVFIGKSGSVYHAGDTGLFGDMALIGELYTPDVALLPIGGHYTMGPNEASKAAELLRAKVIIPMHYDTFDVIKQNPKEFKALVQKRIKSKVAIIKEGQSLVI